MQQLPNTHDYCHFYARSRQTVPKEHVSQCSQPLHLSAWILHSSHTARVVRTLAPYSGRPGFTSLPRDSLSWSFPVLYQAHQVTAVIKRKVVPVLNQLSTTLWRRMAEWRYRFTFSWPRQQLEVSDQLHAPAALPPRKEPPVPTASEAGWAPEAGLDDVEKRKFSTLPGLELRPLGRLARSRSLYRLRYPMP
jgi:hypothetical protein